MHLYTFLHRMIESTKMKKGKLIPQHTDIYRSLFIKSGYINNKSDASNQFACPYSYFQILQEGISFKLEKFIFILLNFTSQKNVNFKTILENLDQKNSQNSPVMKMLV